MGRKKKRTAEVKTLHNGKDAGKGVLRRKTLGIAEKRSSRGIKGNQKEGPVSNWKKKRFKRKGEKTLPPSF